MDFYAVLDKVIDLLRSRGRVTYGALKLQFGLSDEQLAVLKDEIIAAQRLATDEDGRILVWTGHVTGTPEVASPTIQHDQPTHQAPLPQPLPSQSALLPQTLSHSPEAERRQLTVMFCDLVASTNLASQLDPEEYRDVVRAYQRVCSAIITRFDGHIAQLLGDGLLVYFGYPQAHEDDPQRAVRAGLGILDAMGDLNTRLKREKGIQLALRVGIHTGLVVIGDMGEAGHQEQLALGETPNIAARIQGLAQPHTLAISEATYRLVEGYFTCESLGAHTLRGVSQLLNIYRVLGESGARGRLDVAATRGLTPLVGRESEVTLLQERWAQAKSGQGQVVLLSGDAGIGKSRLVQMLKEHVTNEPHTLWECRSVPYFEHTALFPLTDFFQRLLSFQPEDIPNEKVGKLEQMLRQYRLPLEESVPLFAPLLSLSLPESGYAPLHLSPQRQRQKTLETITTMLLELAERQPVLFILEDLHWTDPTTLELLGLLLDQTPTASLLVLLTCRPTFQPTWSHRSYLSEITVNRLSPTQVEQIVHRITDGKILPAEVLQQIIAKTDGVPLFVEEMTKAILESGQLKALDDHYTLTGSLRTLTIPATLHDSLMARLDRLMTGKVIAQLGATIGRQLSYALLQVVSQLDEATLQRELGRLVEAEIVYQRGIPPQSTYVFKHALIQDAAYESLLKSTRQQYHQRIALVLEAQFPETAEAQPELLARHYTEAGLTEKAVYYWYHSGQNAIQRSAHVEAISHLRAGLALLQTLPETPERIQREVDMLIVLGASLIATKGFTAPEVGQMYTRARHLCQDLEAPYQLFPVLRGLWHYYNLRAEYQTAHELGEQLLTLAQHAEDPTLVVEAHRTLGATLFWLGAVASAHTHFTQGIALYDPKQHRASTFLHGENAGVVCRSHAARALWYLGYPDQGLALNDEAVTLAQQVAHPFSLAYALGIAAVFHQCCREWQAVQEHTEAAIRLSQERGLPFWMGLGAMLRGWVLVQQAGQAQAGIEQIHQGLTAYRAMGTETLQPYYLALLAEAYGTLGEPEAGLTALAEALTLAETTGERWYEPELYRLKGALLLQRNSDNQAEAEVSFQHALAIARNQQAKSFELRTATSLARLWQQQGRRQEAHDLLAPVYNWFTEGFDTLDLKDAKALLEELTEGQS
jgi:class 3 adenylate cyclase/predicted ATPase